MASEDPVIRKLRPEDVPGVLELARAAGWNQTAADIEMLLRLAPDACFGVEAAGEIAATATLLPVDSSLAWLGMVLTAERHRRRGFARLLVARTLAEAERLGIATVKLDATDMGRPLYAEMGFRDDQPIERWRGNLKPLRPGTDPAPEGDAILRDLARRSDVFRSDGAWLLVRPGMRARYIGPFVAESEAAAMALLEGAFAPGGDACFWDVLPENAAAVRALARLGFERVRALVRMTRGPEVAGARDRSVYAIRGFELG